MWMGDRTESSYLFQQVAKPCVVDFREEIKRESGIHIEEYKRKRCGSEDYLERQAGITGESKGLLSF